MNFLCQNRFKICLLTEIWNENDLPTFTFLCMLHTTSINMVKQNIIRFLLVLYILKFSNVKSRYILCLFNFIQLYKFEHHQVKTYYFIALSTFYVAFFWKGTATKYIAFTCTLIVSMLYFSRS